MNQSNYSSSWTSDQNYVWLYTTCFNRKLNRGTLIARFPTEAKEKKIHFLLLILRDKVSKQDSGVQNKKHVFRYLTVPHKSPIKRAHSKGCLAGCSTHVGVCNTHLSHKKKIRNECSVTFRLKLNPGSNTPCDSPFTVHKMWAAYHLLVYSLIPGLRIKK